MFSRWVWLAALGCLVVSGISGAASARTWTNHQGKQIEADFVRLDGLNVVLMMAGREVSVPLANLSDGDKQFVFREVAARTLPGVESSHPTTNRGSALADSSPRTDEANDGDESEDSDDASSSRASRDDDPSDGKARVRTWTDDQGNRIRAKFIRIHEGNVILMQGRKAVPCPITKLTLEDQDYLRQLLEARGEGDMMPSPEELAAARRGPSGADAGGGYGGYPGGDMTAGMPSTPSFSPPRFSPPYTSGSYGSGPGAMASAGPSIPNRPIETPYTSSFSRNPATGYTGAPGASSYAGASGSGYGAGASSAAADPHASFHGPSSSMGSGYSGPSVNVRDSFPSVMPGAEVAYNPLPDLPTIPNVQQQIEYYCTNCKKSVPEHINDKCPHCGVYFSYVEQPGGGRKYNGWRFRGGIGGLIAIAIGVVIRMIIYAQRN